MKRRIAYSVSTPEYRQLYDIDRIQSSSSGGFTQDTQRLKRIHEVQMMLHTDKAHANNFEGRITFLSV